MIELLLGNRNSVPDVHDGLLQGNTKDALPAAACTLGGLVGAQLGHDTTRHNERFVGEPQGPTINGRSENSSGCAVVGHATEDSFINKRHSEGLAAVYAGENTLVTFSGDHNSGRPQSFYDMVLAFFHDVMRCDQIRVPNSTSSAATRYTRLPVHLPHENDACFIPPSLHYSKSLTARAGAPTPPSIFRADDSSVRCTEGRVCAEMRDAIRTVH